MDKELFSELADLGFGDIEDVDLFKKPEPDALEPVIDLAENEAVEKSLLYEREIICPVCEKKMLVKAIKKSNNKALKRDSDFFAYYNLINPYFYDVWLCCNCGYAALSSDFLKIKSSHVELVKKKVSPKWQNKSYPETYDVKLAIERYKLALLNYFYTEETASKKAMTCLRVAWMYRLSGDKENEITFLSQAIEGFEHAYTEEKFPFYEMDEFTVMYLLGELYRRVGNDEKAMSWFGKVITAIGAKQKVKEKARDQRDLIQAARKEAERLNKLQTVEDSSEPEDTPSKKSKFFSKFFNR